MTFYESILGKGFPEQLMTPPLVSILIPAYNAENWVAEAVQSALMQTWQNKEVIVVDDGSVDSSHDIAASFSAAGVKTVRQCSKGAGAARNLAFRLSRGAYIQYLDADDTLAPDKIEVQMDRLAREGPGTVASGGFGHVYDTVAGPEYTPDVGWKDFDDPLDWLLWVAHGKAMFPPIVWLTPRHIIETAGPWDVRLTYNDDFDFFTRVLLSSEKIAFCPDARANYRRLNAKSLGRRTDPAARASRLLALIRITENMLHREDSTRTRNACATHFQRFIFSVYPQEPGLRRMAQQHLDRLGVSVRTDFGKGRFGYVSRLVGWKAAKWLRYAYYRLKRTPAGNRHGR